MGGIAGWGDSIIDSTSYGAVSGGNYVGGIAGGAYVVTNSYYGGDSVSGTGPYVGNQAGTVTGSATGTYSNHDLPSDQRAAAIYAAELAALAAQQQEAIFEVNGQQTGGQASFSGQGSNSTGQGLNGQIGSFTPSNTGTVNGTMDNHIVYSSDSGSYSATIKSITADGVQFDMEGGGGAAGGGSGPNK